MMNFTTIAIGALAATIMSPPATAKTPDSDGEASIAVAYSDLDLRSHQGFDRLNRRLRAAAQSYCIDGAVKGVGRTMQQRKCLAATLAQLHLKADRALALSTRDRNSLAYSQMDR